MGQSESSLSESSLYTPLNKSRQEIRLLMILPSGDTVACLMKTVSLYDAPSFVALSYLWGDPSNRKEIEVNGQTISVTTNLVAALEHVGAVLGISPAQHNSPAELWVDAICINQSDVDERNYQVALMRSIFSSAACVFGWLGSGDDEMTLAIESLNLIGEALYNLGPAAEESARLEWIKNFPELCANDLGKENDNYVTGNRRWSAIAKLLISSYWERVWILQECVMAKRFLLMYSFRVITIQALIDISTWILSLETDGRKLIYSYGQHLGLAAFSFLQAGTQRFGPILRIYRIQNAINDDQNANNTLWDLTVYTHELVATRPEDYIYGLLGMMRIQIIPDYTKPLPDIYSEFVAEWLKYCQSPAQAGQYNELRFMRFAGVGLYSGCLGLPSWAPNYPEVPAKGSLPRLSVGPDKWEPYADYNVFTESIGTSSVSGQTLYAWGLRAQEVVKTFQLPTGEDMERFHSFLADYCQRHPCYITGLSPLRAVIQVLCCERSSKHEILSMLRIIDMLLFFFFTGEKFSPLLFQLAGLGKMPEIHTRDIIQKLYPECDEDVIQEALLLQQRGPHPDLMNYVRHSTYIVENWAIVETSCGYLGMAPKGTLKGDFVCILKGSNYPMILRKSGGFYIHVGTSYIEGFMEGEAIDLVKSNKSQVELFKIK
ncbi:HET-domain-containing protein [Hyaloscypha bicolor E]|uniref:HET-domain-containing protein n=1 Tax=Hyaloscypha bicolor E TaxID=1095630 RepID=A0A2J6THQ2_9HELO|nr:HET-domain-containing protein [Hyaloscypha bicolor E]PMD62552.1 HET-domain-containing protein [Hyaloscypha bicolor E]